MRATLLASTLILIITANRSKTMADDYLKKYEEEYEAVYGCNNYGQEYDYNQGQNYNQQQTYQEQNYAHP